MAATGSGLIVLGVFILITAVVVAGIWYGIREREAQHETLRRMIESGQPVDRALMEQLMPSTGGGAKRMDRDMNVGGLVMLSIAVGLALLGWLLGLQFPSWFLPILGIAALTACVGCGLLVAAKVVGNRYRDDNAPPAGQPRA